MAKARKPRKGRRGERFSFKVPYMFGTKRVTVERQTVEVSSLHAEPGKGTLPPRDERLVRLVADVAAGKVPSTNWCLALADLAVHDPPTVGRARAKWLEEPAGRAATVEMYRRRPSRWLVYRRADGRLVMFDDYAAYTAVLDGGREADLWPIALVQICGESAEDLARHEAVAGCGLCAAEEAGDIALARARFLARAIIRRTSCPWEAGLCERHREIVITTKVEGS